MINLFRNCFIPVQGYGGQGEGGHVDRDALQGDTHDEKEEHLCPYLTGRKQLAQGLSKHPPAHESGEWGQG